MLHPAAGRETLVARLVRAASVMNVSDGNNSSSNTEDMSAASTSERIFLLFVYSALLIGSAAIIYYYMKQGQKRNNAAQRTATDVAVVSVDVNGERARSPARGARRNYGSTSAVRVAPADEHDEQHAAVLDATDSKTTASTDVAVEAVTEVRDSEARLDVGAPATATCCARPQAAQPRRAEGDTVLTFLLDEGDEDDDEDDDCKAANATGAAGSRRSTRVVIRAHYMRIVLAFVLLAMLIIGLTMDMSQERREVQQLFATSQL